MCPSLRPSADDLREQLQAKRMLTRLEQFNELAVRWASESQAVLKEGYAQRYRRLFAIHPAQHEEFRAALERIRGGGRMAIQDVIEILNGPTH